MCKFVFSVLLFCALLFTACTPVAAPAQSGSTQSDSPQSGDASERRAVTLGVGFIPSVQFAPFYVGMEKGFFAEAGIDLSLDYGYENDYLKLVGVNESRFLIGSGDQVILGRAQGLPVRYVAAWYTRYPVVLFAQEEAGITRPADMAGKTIGLPGPFGASYVALRGLLEAAGLTEADITLESIGFTQAAAVSEGLVDGALDYAVNGPVVLALEGVDTTVVALDDYLTIPANGLITNEATLAEEPELVAAMVQAMTRAIAYTLANPDEAFAIALQYVPEAGGENETANRAVFDASLPFWTPSSGRMPGATALEDWQAAAEFMQRIGLADVLVPAAELFTNEFIVEEE
ncbi:MAG: ABC transporter substrate-binding protein [Caldilineaceae bacterium]|nr:ABC transporter substrate-binding protein [Caldilineaceae bacterium]